MKHPELFEVLKGCNQRERIDGLVTQLAKDIQLIDTNPKVIAQKQWPLAAILMVSPDLRYDLLSERDRSALTPIIARASLKLTELCQQDPETVRVARTIQQSVCNATTPREGEPEANQDEGEEAEEGPATPRPQEEVPFRDLMPQGGPITVEQLDVLLAQPPPPLTTFQQMVNQPTPQWIANPWTEIPNPPERENG